MLNKFGWSVCVCVTVCELVRACMHACVCTHTVTAPTLSGNFSIIMDMDEVSEAAPPMAEVVLIRKQKTVNMV